MIEVLNALSVDKDAKALSTPSHPAAQSHLPDRPRIDRVLEYIHNNYVNEIKIDELSEVAALSASGFQRLFRRHTRLTPTQYIARLRVGEACALLSSTDRPVAAIAEAVGYSALANFNRQFKALKNMKPRDFRNKFRT